MEPPNKGHIGDNMHSYINSLVLSYVYIERFPLLGGSQCIECIYRENSLFWDLEKHPL